MFTERLTNEIILASIELKTNKVPTIAEKLGYQPILILNALFKGEADGKLTYVKKKEIIRVSEDVDLDSLLPTEGLIDSQAQIEDFIGYRNALGDDITIEDLPAFMPLLPETHLKIAIRTSKKLSTYELADPKDKQSVYTFITLNENLDKQFGKKQFSDDPTKNRFAKAGKKSK